jgi:uncharacterized membrane protein
MPAMPLSLSHLAHGAPPWEVAAIIAALALHIGGGLVGIVSGFASLAVRKGQRLHRLFGTVFFASMLVMAAMASCLAVLIDQKGNIVGGVLTFYLVLTAWAAARQKTAGAGRLDTAAVLIPLGVAAGLVAWGVQAAQSPTGRLDGMPSAPYFVMPGLAALFAVLDVKVIRQGGVFGQPRIARHLWRMCVALFFAAASFFLGQQRVLPAWMHGSPLLYVPALAPLLAMAAWLLRPRLTRAWRAIGRLGPALGVRRGAPKTRLPDEPPAEASA